MKTNSDLKQRAESLIRLHTELDEAKLALADAYEDAESAGYSKAVLRRAIKIHTLDADKRKKHDTAQIDLETYLAEIEGREAAE